ncbi:F17 fimbrial protein (plasmid) [Cupriavidus taiwanensis]|uniref:F17 fimbrial protein n=1 Tax=Cupriavidus taiwanensis TaxID=164546 RepID=A0A375HMB9_9BURK|nr:fimbrial protein [Cupriavidus taiwanensis]SOY67279.1 major type 1 subunit fimbrin (pilin) [Cupriavidus taiwanensis]SOY67539.1 major type 1 subunit fimbrin (pilin) [Cupriavidus taiwanensis]SOY94898.1 major type 1 subunit fimbrin (pilin) [Cupriavidus taiwanensis]SOZ71847.1 major type 1 subunit fimbrin (pilin) [Cupriavidus taiwanensis]SOZ87149.1 major type 1 subunit fimbrin (pilin) [Cupriavidus taiwanensis]
MTNNKLLAALIVAGIAMGAQFAHAADGTITFNGSITAQTCKINGNGSGNHDFTVLLPTVSTSTLKQAGDVAGQTPFNIALTECTPDTGNVHTFFEAGPTTDASTGNLILDANGATNVQIRLLNGGTANTPIKAGYTNLAQNSNAVALVNGAATLWYYAQYYATGQASAGSANSSVMYSIAYE